MKKVNIALVMLGLIIILFAVFCPAIIVKIHSIAWRYAGIGRKMAKK